MVNTRSPARMVTPTAILAYKFFYMFPPPLRKKHFGHLATFWLNTFATLFGVLFVMQKSLQISETVNL